MALTVEQILRQLSDVQSTLIALTAQVQLLTDGLQEVPTPGHQAKVLLKAYAALWSARHRGAEFYINWAKDVAQIKRLLGKNLTPGEIERRMRLFLASTDTFAVNAHFPIGLFVSTVNKFAGPASGILRFDGQPTHAAPHDAGVARLIALCDPPIPRAFIHFFDGARLSASEIFVEAEHLEWIRARYLPALRAAHGAPLEAVGPLESLT